MENLHPTEIRVLEVVRDGKDWRAMRHARKALLEVFPDGFAVVDDDDLVGKILHDVCTHSWEPWPRRVGEKAKVQKLFDEEAKRQFYKKKRDEEQLRARLEKQREERKRQEEQIRKDMEADFNAEKCWLHLKQQGFSVPNILAFTVLYKLSVIEGKVRPEFYDCDRKEMVWFNEEV